MNKHQKLLGNHPTNTLIYDHFNAIDHEDDTLECCHRELILKNKPDPILIEKLATLIVQHHHSAFRLERLKQKYKNLGFSEYISYLEETRRLPRADKTKKGNATEILLTQYVEECLGRALNKVFKLKYNPNVDQAIKGDDTLMVDLDENGEIKVYLGEAKFRKEATKSAITDIEKALGKEKLPLSYTFMVDEIAKKDEELALKLDAYLISEIKKQGNIIYTGFFLSNEKASTVVQDNISSDNPEFILVSLGIENPEDFINNIFNDAEGFLKTGI